MAYRVDLTGRAARNLERIYQTIDAQNTTQAAAWFNGLEKTILSLDKHPARGSPVAEDDRLRQVLYGRRRHRYRIIYTIDERTEIVTVLHIRHGARAELERIASHEPGGP